MPRYRPAKRTLSGARVITSSPWKRARSGARIIGSGYQGRRSTVGRYRKVGYWGRYPGAGGPTHGGELKFHDIGWNEGIADLSGGVISNTSSLVLIGQGITESTRIGRKCTIRSIGWRGELRLDLQAGTVLQPPMAVRLLLVHDSQANGAAPGVATTNGVLQSASWQSFNNLANKGRFHVLSDKTYTINALCGAGDGAANDTAGVSRSFTVFKKCSIPIEYSGTANPSVITELRSNNIFGLMITSTNVSTMSLVSNLRFRFSDD